MEATSEQDGAPSGCKRLQDSEQESLLGRSWSTTDDSDSISPNIDRRSLLSARSIATTSTHRQRLYQDEQCDEEPSDSATQAAKAINLARNDDWIPATPSRPASIATARTDNRSELQIVLDAGPVPPDYAQATAWRLNVRRSSMDEESLYRPGSDTGWAEIRICLINVCVYAFLITVVFTHYPREPDFPFRWALTALHPANNPENHLDEPQFFHHNTSRCKFVYWSGPSFLYWVDPVSFTLNDTIREADYQDFGEVIITGNTKIRPAPLRQDLPLEVVVSFATNGYHFFPWFDFTTGGFDNPGCLPIRRTIERQPNPIARQKDLDRKAAGIPACLDIWVGIYVKAPLEDFNIYTENLNLDAGHLLIRNNSYVQTKNGNVSVSDWDAWNAYFTSDSGSFKGRYILYDHLHIKTNSGAIEAEIAQGGHSTRDNLFGEPRIGPSQLSTVTGSGRQVVSISQNSINKFRDEYIPPVLKSIHLSSTGSIAISSGPMWEGELHARSQNGTVKLDGEELELLPVPGGSLSNSGSDEQWARNGSVPSTLDIETDGDVRFCATKACYSAAHVWNAETASEISNWHPHDLDDFLKHNFWTKEGL